MRMYLKLVMTINLQRNRVALINLLLASRSVNNGVVAFPNSTATLTEGRTEARCCLSVSQVGRVGAKRA
jgi:hypothetical protein